MRVQRTVALAVLCCLAAVAVADDNEEVRWVSQALAEVMSDFVVSSQSDGECNLHSELYLEALANSTLWAVQMLDSSTMSASGLLTGDMYELGHFDQCLGVKVPEAGLRGQYCLAKLQYGPSPQAFPSFYSSSNETFFEPPPSAAVWDKVKMTVDPGMTRRDVFHWALCVPASCTAEDVQQSLNASLEAVFVKYGLIGSVSVAPDLCNRGEVDEIATPAFGYVTIRVVLILYLLVSAIATIYDYMIQNFRDEKVESPVAKKSEKILLAFSIRKNVNELTDKGTDPRLDIINGGKAISMGAILFGHRAMYSFGLALYNNEYWELTQNSFWDLALMNGTHLVDVFFVCSGSLAFIGLYKVLEKRKRLNVVQMVFLRWLRIVPTYMVMMGIVGWLLPHLSDGPLWNRRVGLEARRCQENWWLNLLFINNYVNADNQCLLLSWYLACDMQYFVVAIFVIYVLWRWPKAGYALVAVLLAASIAVPFYVTYRGKYYGILRLYASTLLNDPFSNDHFASVYIKSHNRAGPYIVGVITGYLSVKLYEANYKFSKITILLGFIILFGGGYAHQFYGFYFYQRGRGYDYMENAVYAALHRISFSVGVGWIAITYYTTGFGLFKVLLAQPIFTPLCRLVYALVLIHPVVQLSEASSVRHSEHMTYPKMFWMACGDYLITTLMALPLYLMVEAPGRTIVKVFLARPPRRQGHKTSQIQAQNQNNTQNHNHSQTYTLNHNTEPSREPNHSQHYIPDHKTESSSEPNHDQNHVTESNRDSPQQVVISRL